MSSVLSNIFLNGLPRNNYFSIRLPLIECTAIFICRVLIVEKRRALGKLKAHRGGGVRVVSGKEKTISNPGDELHDTALVLHFLDMADVIAKKRQGVAHEEVAVKIFPRVVFAQGEGVSEILCK